MLNILDITSYFDLVEHHLTSIKWVENFEMIL